MMNARAFTTLTTTVACVLALAACGGGADSGTDSANAAVDTTMAPATGGADTAAASTAASGMLDPNAATRDQLAAVEGMTPAAADAMIAGRPFNTMVDVDRALEGQLSKEQRTQVYAKVWKPIDLNTASDQEILLIPGVGNRMLHEFKEYRPYTNIARFQREIGKYVDDQEVARLQQYVTIR
jgi:DNA uptake protein ComE-like DNA-binding protein